MSQAVSIHGDDKRRFDIELFIVHPFMKPDEITKTLGLAPSITHCVGEPRMTPKGRLLDGNYKDTRWRYSERHTVEDQWFSSHLDKFVNQLAPHKEFLRNIRETNGRTCVIVQFLGDGYFGDEIVPSILSKMADLGVNLGIECYTVPQSP